MDAVPETVVGGRYRLVREIARSGSATVWEAFDPVLDRPVACKLLHPAFTADAAARANLEREVMAAARLVHPNIVATYDAGIDGGRQYLVTELVRGRDLASALGRGDGFAVGAAVTIAGQVAEALAYAHDHGVVHQDLKPANVLVGPDGHVKVSDFAIATTRRGSESTHAGGVAGTARYLAPEQVADEPVDGRADVYSLALVLYEMLAGDLPFSGEGEYATAAARVGGAPRPLRGARSDVPPPLDAAIARALARRPASRYDARGFALALSPFREEHTPDHGVPRVGARPAPRLPPRRDLRPLVALAVLVAVALVIAAVAFGIATRSTSPGAAGRSVAPARPLSVAAIRDFDPEGDNGRENPARVASAIDGDEATAWTSETYTTPAFGGAKDGLGLVLDLGGDRTVRAVEVDGSPGWSGDVVVAATPGADRSSWGASAATVTDAPSKARVELTQPVTGRYILLWFTRLPPSGRVAVDELRVLGT